jgi:hypothetical protein
VLAFCCCDKKGVNLKDVFILAHSFRGFSSCSLDPIGGKAERHGGRAWRKVAHLNVARKESMAGVGGGGGGGRERNTDKNRDRERHWGQEIPFKGMSLLTYFLPEDSPSPLNSPFSYERLSGFIHPLIKTESSTSMIQSLLWASPLNTTALRVICVFKGHFPSKPLRLLPSTHQSHIHFDTVLTC